MENKYTMCNGCDRFDICPLRQFEVSLRSKLCRYRSEAKAAQAKIMSKAAENMRRLTDENFEHNCCRICKEKETCPLVGFDAFTKRWLCLTPPAGVYEAKGKQIEGSFKAEADKMYEEQLKLLNEKNFDAKYCQRCKIRNSCPFMKHDEQMRQWLCDAPEVELKEAADIAQTLLQPLTQSRLN